MSTVRVGRRKKFTTVDRRTINDARLSLRALGLLVWILDKPDEWSANSAQIAREVKEGRDAVRAAMREMEEAGYLVRTKVRSDRGRWSTESVVHERPPKTGFQAPEIPASDDAASDDQPPETGFQAPESRSSESQAVVLLSTVNEDCHLRSDAAREEVLGQPATHKQVVDTLVDECSGGAKLTDLELARYRRAARDLVGVDATTDTIRAACRRYRELWPDAVLTPLGLASNWSLLTLASDALVEDAQLRGPDPDHDLCGGSGWTFDPFGKAVVCPCMHRTEEAHS